jgi:hypothetical protein
VWPAADRGFQLREHLRALIRPLCLRRLTGHIPERHHRALKRLRQGRQLKTPRRLLDPIIQSSLDRGLSALAAQLRAHSHDGRTLAGGG